MTRALVVLLAAVLLPAHRLVDAQPAPPPPSKPSVAVPRHLEAVGDRLAVSKAGDSIALRALAEARISLAAARSALAANALRTADELAASADDLVHAADGPPRRGPNPDAAAILARIDSFASVLTTVGLPRVRSLLTFATAVAGDARAKAAGGRPDAGWEAARAEAIARAATHVALAADPAMAPPFAPPKPPKPPGPPPVPRDKTS